MLPPVEFPTLGFQVAEWMEAYLCHGPGDVQGDDLVIDDEILKFLCWAYRLYPRDHRLAGRRLVNHAILSRPKGRAKSEIAGGLVCAEGLGPVRFDGWDANGEPVGRPVLNPFIRCLATEEDQSANTYSNVEYMLQNGAAADEYQLDVGLTRTFIKEPGGGEIRPSTAGSASKDGGKETFFVADETHLYVLTALRQMYDTVRRNTGKRKDGEPWWIDTTTMWQPGERSIAERVHTEFGRKPVEEAVTKNSVLYDHRQGDEPKVFNNDRSLKKAIRVGYGPAAEWMDLDRIVKLIREAEDPEEEAYRYWLNRERVASSRWLGPTEIEKALSEASPPRGAKVGMGFDGSASDDHTTLWICTREGLLRPVGIWTPTGESIEWHAEVDEAVAWAFEYFDVLNFKFDPAYWIEEGAKWAARWPGKVEEMWTGGRGEGKFAIACGACRTGLRQGTTTINPTPIRTEDQLRDGKQIAVWHFENAQTRKVRVKREDEPAEDAHTVRKPRPGSPLKIDSVPAAVLARRARDDAEKKGLFETPEYESASWGGL